MIDHFGMFYELSLLQHLLSLVEFYTVVVCFAEMVQTFLKMTNFWNEVRREIHGHTAENVPRKDFEKEVSVGDSYPRAESYAAIRACVSRSSDG